MLHALKKMTAVTLVAAMLMVTAASNIGCYTQKFDVGTGGTGGQRQQFTQWFILWGLVPLTNVEDDVEAATAGSPNYTVITQFTALDVLIGIFTNIVTIGPKTVTVEK